MIRHLAFALLGMTAPDGSRPFDMAQVFRTQKAAEDTREASGCAASLVPLMDATVGHDMLAALIDIAEGAVADPRLAARVAVLHAVAPREYLGRSERDPDEIARNYAAAVRLRQQERLDIEEAGGR